MTGIRIFVLCVFLAVGHMAAAQQEKSAAVSGEAGPGELKTLRLQGLPRNGTLAVSVKTDGKIRVLLLDEADAEAFPAATEPLFAGVTERPWDSQSSSLNLAPIISFSTIERARQLAFLLSA